MRLLLLGITDEFLTAFRTSNGNLTLASGNPDHLVTLRTVVVAMLAVFQPVKKLEELPVFLITLVSVPGETAANGPDHQTIGKGGQKQTDSGTAEDGGNHARRQTGAQDRHIQPVGTVAANHETLQLGGQLRHKLSEHCVSPVKEIVFYIILQNERISTEIL